MIDCGEERSQIRAALRKALQSKVTRHAAHRSVYGDGRAGQRTACILASLEITPRWMRKMLTY